MKKYFKWLAWFLPWQFVTTVTISLAYLLFLGMGTGLEQSVIFSMIAGIVYTFFLSAYFGDEFMPTTELCSESTSIDKFGVSFILAALSFWAAKVSALPAATMLVTFCLVFIIAMIVTMEAVIVIMALLAVFAVGSGVPHYAVLAVLGANLTCGFIRRTNNPKVGFGWIVLSSCVQSAVLYFIIANGPKLLSIVR
jgi:hypothetical protein